MIVKTEAIVLSKMKYRDTSRILRLYTREFGKMSVLAKGARDAKSKFRSSLEPMSYVLAVVYKNDNRELQLLSQCDVIVPFRRLSEEMEKMYVAMSMLELVDVVTHDEEQNSALFELLLNSLRAVNDATKNASIALYYFELKLFEILGFKPDMRRCCQCMKPVEAAVPARDGFVIGPSGVLCEGCSSHSGAGRISSNTLRVLQRLQEVESVGAIMNLHLSPEINEEMRLSLRRHLQQHVEGFRRLRSEEVFAAIL